MHHSCFVPLSSTYSINILEQIKYYLGYTKLSAELFCAIKHLAWCYRASRDLIQVKIRYYFFIMHVYMFFFLADRYFIICYTLYLSLFFSFKFCVSLFVCVCLRSRWFSGTCSATISPKPKHVCSTKQIVKKRPPTCEGPPPVSPAL